MFPVKVSPAGASAMFLPRAEPSVCAMLTYGAVSTSVKIRPAGYVPSPDHAWRPQPCKGFF